MHAFHFHDHHYKSNFLESQEIKEKLNKRTRKHSGITTN